MRLELAVVETDDAPLVARHPEIPAELALQGFEGVRAYSSDPERSRSLLEETLAFVPSGDATWEARGERAAAGSPTTRRRPSAGSRRRHRAPRRLGLDAGGPGRLAAPRRGRRPPADAGDRPLLLPVDLLPRAERRPLRARDARPRASRPTRIRSTWASGSRCRRRSSTCATGSSRRSRRCRIRAARGPRRDRGARATSAAEPEGALVLLHGRGADERDLYPLLDALDPERRLLGSRPGGRSPCRPAARTGTRLGGIPTPDPDTFWPTSWRVSWLDALDVPLERHRPRRLLAGRRDELRDRSRPQAARSGRRRCPALGLHARGGRARPRPHRSRRLPGHDRPRHARPGDPRRLQPGPPGEALADSGADVAYHEGPYGHTIDPGSSGRCRGFVASALDAK